jgi:hypothetical protein
MLEEASAPLERFFAPYNQLLREIIGPTFGWEAKDHRKRPLSPEQRAAALATIKRDLKKQRNGHVSRRIAEKMKVDEVRKRTSRGVVTPLKELPWASSPSDRGRGRGRGREGGGGDDKEGLRAARKKKKLAHKAELQLGGDGKADYSKALRRQKKLKLGARAADSAVGVAAVAAITRRRRGEDSSASTARRQKGARPQVLA